MALYLANDQTAKEHCNQVSEVVKGSQHGQILAIKAADSILCGSVNVLDDATLNLENSDGEGLTTAVD